MSRRRQVTHEQLMDLKAMNDRQLVEELSFVSRCIGGFEGMTIGGKYDYSEYEYKDIDLHEAIAQELLERLAKCRGGQE